MTVRDIAAAAGVSITTVSRVLNGGAKVKPETRERVEAIIREGGYLRRERAVRPKPDKRVLIVMPATTDSRPYAHPTIHTILTGLTARLRELGIDYTQYRLQETRESASGIMKSTADGFLFIRTNIDQEDALIPRLLERERPVMVVNRRMEDKRLSYINIDDFAAAYRAAGHLIKLGHRRIAMVNGDITMRNSQLRRDGYLQAMRELGVTVPDAWMLPGAYSEEHGRAAAAALLALPEASRPTAIFAASDTIACGVQKTLRKAGLSLPYDMSLVGFDDSELAACMTPPLTSVRMPAREMGMQAAMAMDFLLHSPSVQTVKIQMKSELSVRESTCAWKGKL